MARKVQVLLVDDLDGTDLGEEGETLAFAVGSERYEIDLSHANAEKFRTQMGQYTKAARNVTRIGSRGTGTTRRATTGATRGGSSDETKAARAWLIEQGILTAESRGRISQDNWEKYRARNQQSIPAQAPKAATAEKAATSGTAETAQTADKTPRGNSTTPAKASAGTSGTPGESKAKTGGLAKLLPGGH